MKRYDPARVKLTLSDIQGSIFHWTTTDSIPEIEKSGHPHCFYTRRLSISIQSNIQIDHNPIDQGRLGINSIWLLCNGDYTSAIMYITNIDRINVGYSRLIRFYLSGVQCKIKDGMDRELSSSTCNLYDVNQTCDFSKFDTNVPYETAHLMKTITLHENNCDIEIESPERLSEKVNGKSQIRKRVYVLSFQLQPRPP